MKLSKPLNRYFDHTLLKPEATRIEIALLCQEAMKHDFYSVCVNSCYADLAKKLLGTSNVKLTCVAGFPLGACDTEAKRVEAEKACLNGADEIDMVINIGAVKNDDYEYLQNDISAVATICHKHGAKLKAIIETCLLTDVEIKRVSRAAEKAGADFIKTSTGFSTGGAKAEDIELIKKYVSKKTQVKASGGISDLDTALEMIKAGADRIGASKSVLIIKEYEKRNKKK